MKKVVVFCSSSDVVSPIFFSDVKNLGKGLAENKISLVYGGAQVGLMGALANQVLELEGEVFGIIPESLCTKEVAHQGLTQLQVVSDMMDRKKAMIEGVDAVLVYPGGIGTLDEAFEVLTLKQLGLLKAPILFVNTMGYWEDLFAMITSMQQQKMISQDNNELFDVVEDAQEAVNWLKKVEKN